MKKLILLLAIPFAGALACDFGDPTRPPATFPINADKPSERRVEVKLDPRGEAMAIFRDRCSACHGPSGAGDGPAAVALTPKPANFGSKAWQAATSDDQIERIIVAGGGAVGKSPLMPANPDLGGRDEVVHALRVHVRSLGGVH